MPLTLIRPRATDSLSADAVLLLLAGFKAKKTNAVIAREIKEATGEIVATRTIGRRKSEWWNEKLRHDAAYETQLVLCKALQDIGIETSEIAQAQINQKLLNGELKIDAATVDPVRAVRVGLEAERIANQGRMAAVREREAAIKERRLDQLEAAEIEKKQIAAELKEKAKRGDAITAEDLKRFDEAHGIV